MDPVANMLRLPRGRARTQDEKAADAALWTAGKATCDDDIFTLMSIPDSEAEMFHVMGFFPGPRIAVPGLTPESGEYPVVVLRGEQVLSVRQPLDIALARTGDVPFEVIGHISLMEMDQYPDYGDLRQFMACKIMESLGFMTPEGCYLTEPPEYVMDGCYSGFSPEGWRRMGVILEDT